MSTKPIRYNLQAFIGMAPSVLSIESSTPLPAICVGDRFNLSDIELPIGHELQDGEAYRVKDISHIFSESERHLSHILMIYLEVGRLEK